MRSLLRVAVAAAIAGVVAAAVPGLASVALAVDASYRGVDFVTASKGWAVGRDATIVRTTNGGRTWTRQHFERPTAAAQGPTLADVCFLRDGVHGWAVGTGGSVYRTTNAGRRWTKVTGFYVPDPNANLTSVKFVNANVGWVSGGQTTLAGGAELPWGGIWRSVDGGRTWSTPAATYYGWCPLSLDAVSATSAMCFGVQRYDDGVTRRNDPAVTSTTDGVAWAAAPALLGDPGGDVASGALDIAARGHVVIAGMNEAGTSTPTFTFASTDGGGTFSIVLPLVEPASLTDVKLATATVGYAVGGDAPCVLKTTDGGFTWQVKSTPYGRHLLAVDFVSAKVGYAVGLRTSTGKPLVVKTTNGARTWRRVK